MHDKIFWTFVAALTCVSCTAESGDDTGGDTSSGSATQSDSSSGSSGASNTMPVTDGTSSEDGSESGASTSAEESTGHSHESTGHHDESTGHHDESSGDHDTGTTGQTVCEILGEGCHDNKTPEGIECHLAGHDGDEAVCEEIFDMCAKICGL